MERTLVIVKPDAVERGLVGEILGRLERKGMHFVVAELSTMARSVAERHYEEHRAKPFYEELLVFITRSPSLVVVVEGPVGTQEVVRALIGATDPKVAAPGTIRGDFGIELPDNLVHGSDSSESAAREIALFFPDLG